MEGLSRDSSHEKGATTMGEVKTVTVTGKKVAKAKIDINTTASATEVASVLGLSVRRVQQMMQDGTMTTVERGVLNLSMAVQQYIAFVTKDIGTDEDEEAESLKLKSDAKLKQAKAVVASLDAQERMGKMHRSEDVSAMTTDLIYAIRSSLLALPGRLAVDVLEAKDKAEASDIIRNEIYKVMEELSNYEYDPEKYRERVRERLRLEALNEENAD